METRYKVGDGGSGSARCTDKGRRHGALWGQWTRTLDRGRRSRDKGQRTSHNAHKCSWEGEKTEVRTERKTEKFLLQRLRGERNRELGGKRPYLCHSSPPPWATHSHLPFSTPELRAVSMGFPPCPSSVRFPAVLLHMPVVHRRIRRYPIGWFSTPVPSLLVAAPANHYPTVPVHTHALLIFHRIQRRITHVSLLYRPAVSIHAPAVSERGC